MPVVWIPPLMRDVTGGQERVAVPGERVRELVAALEARFPGIEDRLSQDGRLRPGIVVAVDGVSSVQGLRQRVREDSEVHFIPGISGG